MSCGISKPEVSTPEVTEVVKPQPVPAPPVEPTLMELEYGNQSSRMKLKLDIHSQDVHIRMSGRPGASPLAKKELPWKKPTALDSAWEESQSAESKPAQEAYRRQTAPDRGSGIDTNTKVPVHSAESKIHLPAQENKPAASLSNSNSPPLQLDSLKAIQANRAVTSIRHAQDLFYQKKYAEAVSLMQTAVKETPTAEGWALLGSSKLMAGDTLGAREAWLSAQKINPDLPSLQQNISKLSPSLQPQMQTPSPR